MALASHSVVMPRERWAVFVVAGWSGFYVMALELLGGRVLAPVFGSSLHVWGSLISVCMLALAAGYLLGGHWSLRNPSLLRLALLLCAGTVATLPLLVGTEPLLDWLGTIADPRPGALLAAALFFLLPSVCLGMVSPYGLRLLAPTEQTAGQYAGRLYFVSTLGSAIGTLATSFFLVLWFEVATLLWTLALISLAVAAGAWQVQRCAR